MRPENISVPIMKKMMISIDQPAVALAAAAPAPPDSDADARPTRSVASRPIETRSPTKGGLGTLNLNFKLSSCRSETGPSANVPVGDS